MIDYSFRIEQLIKINAELARLGWHCTHANPTRFSAMLLGGDRVQLADDHTSTIFSSLDLLRRLSAIPTGAEYGEGLFYEDPTR